MDQPIFRPFVAVSMAHGGETTTVLDGLVDTGADAILASDLLAEELGIDLDDHEGETSHGVGGKYHKAQYKTVSLRLHAGDAELSECHRDPRSLRGARRPTRGRALPLGPGRTCLVLLQRGRPGGVRPPLRADAPDGRHVAVPDPRHGFL
jgi:hypothetical protein